MKSLLEQVEENPVPRQQPVVRVLHVHLGVDVDELAECAVGIDHVEGADEARLLVVGERRLIFAVADRRKQPQQILQIEEPEVRLHELRKGHRACYDRQVALEEQPVGVFSHEMARHRRLSRRTPSSSGG